MRFLLGVGLLLGLAGVALAADEVLLNAGDVVKGEIQSVDENGIAVLADGKTLTIAPADLDAHYYYEQWAKRVPKDAESHLRLAVFAYENGMFNQAKTQYHRAQRLDKEVVQKFEDEVLPKIKEGVAANLLRLTGQAIDRKDWNTAKRLAAKILTQLEDTKAAEEAREKLASVQTWQLNADEDRLVKSLARYLPKDEAQALKVKEKIAAKLGPIQTRMKKAQDLVAKGLQTKSANRQKGIFEQAAKRFESIIKDLDKLAVGDDDPALKAHVAELRSTAVRDAIDAYVHAGGVYLVRRSYDKAIQMANAALALDPDSQHAKRFYQSTLAGSQMRSGWGGGRGR